ncbi:oxidoreductase, molybdopterin-binding protein, partial [mine drainage metagenome]
TPGTDGLLVFALIHCLLEAGRIDTEFLVRYTNAHHLVTDAPGAAEHGLIARDAAGRELCFDRASGTFLDAQTVGTDPALIGEFALPDGRRARPAFALLAERYCGPQYAPEAVASRCGIDAATIRRIAAEIAEVAFNQAVVIDQPWTDTAGRRHATMTGRPVAMHAMRGVSAHSNGFHTCRAIHVLQMLLGAIDTPGSWRYKSPYPKPIPGASRPGVPYPGRPARCAPARLSARTAGSAGRRGRRAAAARPGVFLGGPHRHSRPDAHGDRTSGHTSRPRGNRHVVPVHVEHGVEFGDE